MEEIQVWGFPTFKYKFENQSKIRKEILQNANKQTLDDMSEDWNASCKSTAASREIITMPNFHKELKNIIYEKFSKDINIPSSKMTLKGCSNVSCTEECPDYWINVYTKNDHQDVHYHMNEGDKTPLFSFAYFVKYDPEKDAQFYFYNPSPAPNMYEEFTGIRPAFKERMKLDISEGEIIIFPPFMLHGVDKHLSDNTRITVAGNIYR